MDAPWLRRYRLIGDEDCGVGIECRDHFDGGRPLAHYSSDTKPTYADDPLVQNVTTIAGLLTAAEAHEHEKHSDPIFGVVNVHVQGPVLSERELAETVQRHLRRRPPGGGAFAGR